MAGHLELARRAGEMALLQEAYALSRVPPGHRDRPSPAEVQELILYLSFRVHHVGPIRPEAIELEVPRLRGAGAWLAANPQMVDVYAAWQRALEPGSPVGGVEEELR